MNKTYYIYSISTGVKMYFQCYNSTTKMLGYTFDKTKAKHYSEDTAQTMIDIVNLKFPDKLELELYVHEETREYITHELLAIADKIVIRANSDCHLADMGLAIDIYSKELVKVSQKCFDIHYKKQKN